MYYGAYADIFTQNTFIRKPIQNQDLIKQINDITGNSVSLSY